MSEQENTTSDISIHANQKNRQQTMEQKDLQQQGAVPSDLKQLSDDQSEKNKAEKGRKSKSQDSALLKKTSNIVKLRGVSPTQQSSSMDINSINQQVKQYQKKSQPSLPIPVDVEDLSSAPKTGESELSKSEEKLRLKEGPSAIKEEGGLPRLGSQTSRMSRAVRQLFCCGVAVETASEENIASRDNSAI